MVKGFYDEYFHLFDLPRGDDFDHNSLHQISRLPFDWTNLIRVTTPIFAVIKPAVKDVLRNLRFCGVTWCGRKMEIFVSFVLSLFYYLLFPK